MDCGRALCPLVATTTVVESGELWRDYELKMNLTESSHN